MVLLLGAPTRWSPLIMLRFSNRLPAWPTLPWASIRTREPSGERFTTNIFCANTARMPITDSLRRRNDRDAGGGRTDNSRASFDGRSSHHRVLLSVGPHHRFLSEAVC